MTFWTDVYNLRKGNLIPKQWKRSDIREYLLTKGYPLTTIGSLPSNQSISRDGSIRGDYIKKGSEKPKAWRIGSGKYELIEDPMDSIDQQQHQKDLAMKLLVEKELSPNLYTNPTDLSQNKIKRILETPEKTERDSENQLINLDNTFRTNYLLQKEQEGIANGFATLAYNRSQGRSLHEGSNKEFIKFIINEVWPNIVTINSREAFDSIHHQWVITLRNMIKQRNGKNLSYGQGQKSLNVWLKFYIDWASRPDSQTANRLRPWLHCPLDKVIMDNLKDNFKDEYQRRIVPHYEKINVPSQQRHSLSKMDEELYLSWQAWIKQLSPNKPVLLDLIWVFKR